MTLIRTATLYFLSVFAAGFILGVFRVLILVPHLGERHAELLELPLMVVISFLSATWLTPRLSPPHNDAASLAMGFLALSLLLVAELAMVWLVRGQSLPQYLHSRDLVSGTAYALSLGCFALFPFLTRKLRRSEHQG